MGPDPYGPMLSRTLTSGTRGSSPRRPEVFQEGLRPPSAVGPAFLVFSGAVTCAPPVRGDAGDASGNAPGRAGVGEKKAATGLSALVVFCFSY